MKSIRLTLLCALAALLTFACTEATSPTNLPTTSTATASPAAAATATPDEFAAARTNYKKNCESCHGEKAEGGIVKVENKKLKVPSLKTGHAIHHPDADLVKKINTGEDGMPAFKDKLKPEEIQELVRLIRKEFQGQ
jgi:mono/diheme cytochrome c family protein